MACAITYKNEGLARAETSRVEAEEYIRRNGLEDRLVIAPTMIDTARQPLLVVLLEVDHHNVTVTMH